MPHVSEFSNPSSVRVPLSKTSLTSAPFQLLPRATYPLAYIERSLEWQNLFVDSLKRKPMFSFCVFPIEFHRKEIDFRRLFESFAIQAYREFEVLCAVRSEEEAEIVKDLFDSLGLDGKSILLHGQDDEHSVVECAKGNFIFFVTTDSILHPHCILALAKVVATGDAHAWYANEVTVSCETLAPRSYLRRTSIDRLTTLSFDCVGTFFGFDASIVSELQKEAIWSGLSPLCYGWKFATWIIKTNRIARLIPLGLRLKSESSNVFDSSSSVYYLPRIKHEVSKLICDYGSSINVEVDSVEFPIEVSEFYARPRLKSAKGTIQVVIPFHNKSELTCRCLRSLSMQDCIADIVVTLVDNCSGAKERKVIENAINSLGMQKQVNIIDDDGYFNFARLNNRAVADDASGFNNSDYILFLNNDVSLNCPDTISEMRNWINLSGVSIVGGRLFLAEGGLQHGGVYFTSIRPENVSTNDQFGFLAREVNAVTFAMALVRRDVFMNVGGLDESVCPNGFGDALFCHKVKRDTNTTIVYTPFATAVHEESATRARMPEELEIFEMHSNGIPISDLYGDMEAKYQLNRLILSEIEPLPVFKLLSRVQRVRWLFSFANNVANFILKFWPRRFACNRSR